MGTLLTTEDLTERWKCSKRTVFRAAERGLPYVRLPGGRRLLFDLKDVEAFEAEGRVEGARGWLP